MTKIRGLDSLQRQLQDATRALKALDGTLGTVRFDPQDPGSIEAAVQQISKIIDEKVANYSSNPIIGPLAEKLKASYRESIIQRAAEARLKGED